MNFKQVIGVLVLLIGIGLIGFSIYGNQKLVEANQQIAGAQKKVNQGKTLFDQGNNPIIQGFGKQITGSAQNKIDEAKMTVQDYATLFQQCQYGGIALAVIGSALIIFCRNKKR